MYTKDGKPIHPDYRKKTSDVSAADIEALRADLDALRLEIEELKLAKVQKVESVEKTDDIDALKAEAESLGIEVKGNWGANRIKKAIEELNGGDE